MGKDFLGMILLRGLFVEPPLQKFFQTSNYNFFRPLKFIFFDSVDLKSTSYPLEALDHLG